jgi:hypothetical protein
LGRPASAAGHFVGKHDHGISQPESGVAYFSGRGIQAKADFPAEGLLVKVDGGRAVLHGQLGLDGMVAVGDRH